MNKIKNTLFSNKPVTINNDSIIMALESSCDETACAIVKGGREVLANVVASQIKIHEAYGGVIPEIAAREHLEAVNVVIEEAFKQALLYAPDKIEAKYNLALLYENNNKDKAKELYIEILEQDPTFEEAKNALNDMSVTDFY